MVEDEKEEGTTYFTVEDRSTQGMRDECHCLLLGRKRAGAEAAWVRKDRHYVTYVIQGPSLRDICDSPIAYT